MKIKTYLAKVKTSTIQVLKRIPCLFGIHTWTSKAIEKIPPTKKQIDDKLAGFWDYAKMYCKNCGSISETCKHARK